MAESKHTPLPWHYQEESDAYTHIVRDPSGRSIVAQLPQDTSGKSEANARYIVKCCNAYPALVEALKAVQSELAQMSGRMAWIASHLEDREGNAIDIRDLRDTKRQCSDAYCSITAALRAAGEEL